MPPPYLKRVWLDENAVLNLAAYPYCLPLFKRGSFELVFDRPVTIIAGENGVGKSTLLEGIAVLAGFDESGGGPGYRAVDNSRATETGGGELAQSLKASWLPKVGRGWFLRAESFFAVARYLDEAGSDTADFLSHSHGEGFIRFFEERCTQPGIFIFDEPESALSPNRQFDFLKLLHRMELGNQSQVLIVTHSPIIMGHPGARLLRMSKYGLDPVALQDTEHFRIMREFIDDPYGMIQAMTEE
ncbi:AAA family ATPase [Sphingomonas bacterium]|uniref:AAA family ATPase n=1 Tax=Sphingomonas bacterium TaxID=1895847 RepID=UPI0020C69899|nr:AAA family ATPase [Sphingomonas bacterium]